MKYDASAGQPPPNPAWERALDRAVLALARSPWGSSGHGRPRGIMHIFRLVERLLERGHPTRALRPDGVVRYELTPLSAGRPLTLPGRPPVRRGEPVIAIHFDNRAIAALAATAPSTRRLTWELARIAVLDLRELAALRRAGGFPSGVRVAWAETLFYTALARYGFSILPAPRALRTPFARLFMLSLLAIYGRPGVLNDERARRHLQLGEAWIDLDELERRFPPASDIAVD